MSCMSMVAFPFCDRVYAILVAVVVPFQLSMWCFYSLGQLCINLYASVIL